MVLLAHRSERVAQQRLESEFGGADERSVDAQRRGHDLEVRHRGIKSALPELGVELVDDERVDPAEEPSEHNDARVEHVDQTAETDGEPTSFFGERFERRLVAGGRVGEYRVDTDSTSFGGPTGSSE